MVPLALPEAEHVRNPKDRERAGQTAALLRPPKEEAPYGGDGASPGITFLVAWIASLYSKQADECSARR
jgi:hypothetical protein